MIVNGSEVENLAEVRFRSSTLPLRPAYLCEGFLLASCHDQDPVSWTVSPRASPSGSTLPEFLLQCLVVPRQCHEWWSVPMERPCPVYRKLVMHIRSAQVHRTLSCRDFLDICMARPVLRMYYMVSSHRTLICALDIDRMPVNISQSLSSIDTCHKPSTRDLTFS